MNRIRLVRRIPQFAYQSGAGQALSNAGRYSRIPHYTELAHYSEVCFCFRSAGGQIMKNRAGHKGPTPPPKWARLAPACAATSRITTVQYGWLDRLCRAPSFIGSPRGRSPHVEWGTGPLYERGAFEKHCRRTTGKTTRRCWSVGSGTGRSMPDERLRYPDPLTGCDLSRYPSCLAGPDDLVVSSDRNPETRAGRPWPRLTEYRVSDNPLASKQALGNTVRRRFQRARLERRGPVRSGCPPTASQRHGHRIGRARRPALRLDSARGFGTDRRKNGGSWYSLLFLENGRKKCDSFRLPFDLMIGDRHRRVYRNGGGRLSGAGDLRFEPGALIASPVSPVVFQRVSAVDFPSLVNAAG